MIKVEICLGARCTMYGAVDILDKIEELKADFPQAEIEIIKTKCQHDCMAKGTTKLPTVKVNNEVFHNATPQEVMSEIMKYVDIDEEE